jgi:hypothetical protein
MSANRSFDRHLGIEKYDGQKRVLDFDDPYQAAILIHTWYRIINMLDLSDVDMIAAEIDKTGLLQELTLEFH